jgi:rhodanese-related sulfurtransferase
MKKHILTIVLSIVFGILILSMIGKKVLTSSYSHSAQEQAKILVANTASFSLFDLSMALKENNANILLVDIRSEKEFTNGHLPNAINIPIEVLLNTDLSKYIDFKGDKQLVLYGNTESDAIRALSLLLIDGNTKVKALNGGYPIAKEFIVENPTPSYFHYSDEQIQFNYGRLMPAGTASMQTATEPISDQPSTPRGGC